MGPKQDQHKVIILGPAATQHFHITPHCDCSCNESISPGILIGNIYMWFLKMYLSGVVPKLLVYARQQSTCFRNQFVSVFLHLEPMNHLRSLGFAESIFYFWTILLVWHSNHTYLFEYVDLLRQLASQLAQCWKIVANYLMLQPIIQRITKQKEFLLINLYLVLKLIHNKFIISLQAYQLWRLIFK